MKSKTSKALRREQLDRSLRENDLRHLPQHKRGWIREVREALGMSAQQLALRMGVSQPTVAKMEKSEAAGTITLQSLKKAGDAMGCRFTYAFVPREQETLEALLRARATEVAARLLDRVEHTMALEAQGADREFRERRVRELADEMVRTLSRDLWQESSAAVTKAPTFAEPVAK